MGLLISNKPDEVHALCGLLKRTKAWSIRLGAHLCREHAGKNKTLRACCQWFSLLANVKNAVEISKLKRLNTGTESYVYFSLDEWKQIGRQSWICWECFVPSLFGTFLSFFVMSKKPKKRKCGKILEVTDGTVGPEKDLRLYRRTWLGILFHHSLATFVFQPQIQKKKPLNSFQDLGGLESSLEGFVTAPRHGECEQLHQKDIERCRKRKH